MLAQNGRDSKVATCSPGDLGSEPGSGRSAGEEDGHPLQCPCLESPMDLAAQLLRTEENAPALKI